MPILSFITNLDEEMQVWVSWVVNIWQILVKCETSWITNQCFILKFKKKIKGVTKRIETCTKGRLSMEISSFQWLSRHVKPTKLVNARAWRVLTWIVEPIKLQILDRTSISTPNVSMQEECKLKRRMKSKFSVIYSPSFSHEYFTGCSKVRIKIR